MPEAMPQSHPPRRRITKKGAKPLKSALPPFLLHVLSDSIYTTADYDNCPHRHHPLNGGAPRLVTIHDKPHTDYENCHLRLQLLLEVEASDKYTILFRMCFFFRCDIPE